MSEAPIIVAVDLSAESLAALAVAVRLGAGLRRRVIAVHAVGLLEEAGYRPVPDLDAAVDAARRARADAGGIEVVREDGPAADVIVRIAEREASDMIVIGTRGLGAAPRMLGSVSEAVLARATVPVVVVPAPGGDPQQS